MNYYHAGPAGLSEILPLRTLIDNGILSVEAAIEMWNDKWGEDIYENDLLAHPTMDEISLTTDLSEAQWIASLIKGVVYEVINPSIIRINEEGYPVTTATSNILAIN